MPQKDLLCPFKVPGHNTIEDFLMFLIHGIHGCNRQIVSTIFQEQQVKDVLNQAPQTHPRLLISEERVKDIMKKVDASNDLKILHETVLKQADILIDQAPLERTFIGRRLLATSVKALKRITVLGWAHHSNGDEKYLERAEKEMLARSLASISF